MDELIGLAFTHWEFFLLLFALMGLYTIHRLSLVDEPGTVAPRELVQHAWSSARQTLRNASSVAGLRLAVSFPGGDLIKSREPRRLILATLFAREEGSGSAKRDAVGALLGAAFARPAGSAEFDAMLVRIDAGGTAPARPERRGVADRPTKISEAEDARQQAGAEDVRSAPRVGHNTCQEPELKRAA